MTIPPVAKTTEPWDKWEKYPANLSPSICSPFAYDLDFISEKLSQDSSRLFIAGDRIYIRVIEVGVQGKARYSEKSLFVLTVSGFVQNLPLKAQARLKTISSYGPS